MQNCKIGTVFRLEPQGMNWTKKLKQCTLQLSPIYGKFMGRFIFIAEKMLLCNECLDPQGLL